MIHARKVPSDIFYLISILAPLFYARAHNARRSGRSLQLRWNNDDSSKVAVKLCQRQRRAVDEIAFRHFVTTIAAWCISSLSRSFAETLPVHSFRESSREEDAAISKTAIHEFRRKRTRRILLYFAVCLFEHFNARLHYHHTAE